MIVILPPLVFPGLFMASLSSLCNCLWARPAYPRVVHLKVSSIGQTPALPTNIRIGWKLTSLLRRFVKYGRKKFYNLGPSTRWTNSAPYRNVTTRDAISDLPEIESGENRSKMNYGKAPQSHFQKLVRSVLFCILFV